MQTLTKAHALAIQAEQVNFYAGRHGEWLRAAVAAETTADQLPDEGAIDVVTVNRHIPRGGAIESIILRGEAVAWLRQSLLKNQTVYVIERWRSSGDGHRREVSLFVVRDRQLVDITARAAEALGERMGDHRGMLQSYVGADIAEQLCWRLSKALWPEDTLEFGTFAKPAVSMLNGHWL